MKTCPNCTRVLSEESFAFRNKAENKRHYNCNDCRRATAKASYAKHKSKTISKSMERTRNKREWFQELKQGLSCCVCGESDPACLDFHHIDPSEKDFALSDSVGVRGKAKLLEELNKCACLCANCHRKYHAGRLNAPLVKLEIM